MKNKGYIFAIAVLLLVVLCGCGKETAPVEDAATTTTTTTVTTTTTTATPYPFVGYINATTLNVRPTPDLAGYPIGGLKWGDTVTVLSREGDWYAIQFGGQTGYIHVQYVQDTVPVVTTTPSDTTTAATVTTAGTTVDTVGP